MTSRSIASPENVKMVADLNNVLGELRKHADPETGIRTFSMTRFVRDLGLSTKYEKIMGALKRLGLIENLGRVGNGGSIWRVDISGRQVVVDDLSSNKDTTQAILVRQLKAERAKSARLQRQLTASKLRVVELTDELVHVREIVLNELLASLVLFLEEQQDPQF